MIILSRNEKNSTWQKWQNYLQINIEWTVMHKIWIYEQLCIFNEHINPFVVYICITHIYIYIYVQQRIAFQLYIYMACRVGTYEI